MSLHMADRRIQGIIHVWVIREITFVVRCVALEAVKWGHLQCGGIKGVHLQWGCIKRDHLQCAWTGLRPPSHAPEGT